MLHSSRLFFLCIIGCVFQNSLYCAQIKQKKIHPTIKTHHKKAPKSSELVPMQEQMNTLLWMSPGIEGEAGRNQLEIALAGKANINMQDANGNTTLMHAVIMERWEMVILLVFFTSDIKVDLANHEGKTPLQVA